MRKSARSTPRPRLRSRAADTRSCTARAHLADLDRRSLDEECRKSDTSRRAESGRRSGLAAVRKPRQHKQRGGEGCRHPFAEYHIDSCYGPDPSRAPEARRSSRAAVAAVSRSLPHSRFAPPEEALESRHLCSRRDSPSFHQPSQGALRRSSSRE